jgi:hypothetical protein
MDIWSLYIIGYYFWCSSLLDCQGDNLVAVQKGVNVLPHLWRVSS